MAESELEKCFLEFVLLYHPLAHLHWSIGTAPLPGTAPFFPLSQGKTSWPSTTNCLTIFNKCYGASGKKFATAASVCSIGLIMDMNQYSYVSKPPSFCDRKQSQSPQRHFMLLSIFIDFAGIRSVAVCRSLPWLIYLANNVTWYQDQVAVQLALIGDAM